MDFIQKKHLPVTQVGEDGREVALDLYGRPGALLVGHAHLVGDDGGQRRLAQPRRAIEQNVVQGFAA